MAKTSDEWTPYGLEAIRHAHIRRRRIFGILTTLGIVILASNLAGVKEETSLSISVNGREVSQGLTIDAGGDEEEAKNYVTVALQPGRVARLETGPAGPAEERITEQTATQAPRAKPIPWKLWLYQLLPLLMAALAAWFLFRKRGKYDEVNFGIYKGAMPLEMITAQHDRSVFTKRWVKASVFGKGRRDHVPAEVQGAREDR